MGQTKKNGPGEPGPMLPENFLYLFSLNTKACCTTCDTFLFPI